MLMIGLRSLLLLSHVGHTLMCFNGGYLDLPEPMSCCISISLGTVTGYCIAVVNCGIKL